MAVPQGYICEEKYFEDVLSFLKEYQWVFSSPNTHILVDGIFDQMPSDWKAYFDNIPICDLKNFRLGIITDQAPKTLKNFFQQVQKLTPDIQRHTSTLDFKFARNAGLGQKKKHEILALAPLINTISLENGCDLILDVGTGVGYLPQLLHEKYNLRILGVEGSSEKINLARQYLRKHPKSVDFVHFEEHFVTETSAGALASMVEKIPMFKACITGLHACADLSVTILDLFARLDFAKSLVIMPCCYHRLEKNGDGFKNFPVSTLLTDVSNKHQMTQFLCIPFLRLACQCSGDSFTNMTEEEHHDQAQNCMFRAILQEVAHSENQQVRRLKRKSGVPKQSTPVSSPFETYLTNLKHTHTLIGSEISDEEFLRKMHEKWTEHKGNLRLIEALTAFQASIQHICENIVLLDRVMFLREKGVKCFVVKVTDQRISPRCHALVAIKV